MELEFDKRGLQYLKPLLQEVQTQEQTQELRLPDGMADLGHILGTWGQVILRSKEWRGDRVSITGGVMAFVLYAPEDGSGPGILESWIPFQMKWDLEDGQREGELRVQCLLRFLDARVVSPRKIMLRCGIGAFGQAFRQETAQISVPGNLPGSVQLKKNRYPLRLPKMAGEKAFQMEEELSLPGNPGKLVSYQLEPRITECRMVSQRLMFRGTGLLHVVHLDETGGLMGHNLEVPFSQLIEPEGELSADAQGNIRMAVTGLELSQTPEGKLMLKAGLLAQYMLDDRELLEIVEDAYSPEQLLIPQLGELELPQILDRQQNTLQIRQTVRQDVRDIADVTYLPDFPVRHRGDGVQLELPGMFQVLWYDEGGTLRSTTSRTEENWDMPAGENTRITATVLPGEPPVASPGSGMELRGETVVDVTAAASRGIPMVTGITLGERLPGDPARPSLILRRAGNAGLWDIAKSTGSTVDAIRRANGLEAEPRPEQILLIPVS
jgi:hypothetical protein